MGEVENRGVEKGVGSMKKYLENERYHYDQGEERNPMGQVYNKGVGGTTILFFLTPMELYSDLNNTAMVKWPNS
jgi:hypothetical protein